RSAWSAAPVASPPALGPGAAAVCNPNVTLESEHTMNFTIGKKVTGLAVAAIFLGVSALPAAANTVDVDLSDGDLILYDMFSNEIATIDLSEPGEPCEPEASSWVT